MPEEREKWDWLADAAGQARGPVRDAVPAQAALVSHGSQSGITSAADRERLVALFADAAVARGVQRVTAPLPPPSMERIWRLGT